MTQDVRQWLAEIKTLQQKLTEAQQERDDAQKSAANWQNLYETEAKQRRTEAKLARQKVDALQTELGRLKGATPSPIDSTEASGDRLQNIQQQISQLDSIEVLQARLAEVMLEQERLAQALQSEQAAHQQTRIELTSALGDAINRLTQERARSSGRMSDREESAIGEPTAILPPSRNPSLELPQFE
ncbi:hypothetical protein [Leptolyngbya ohadii]|uniref:hypothetical protein n=1 Tax=Leptolyngbya ohadii TaxID=1962290 RepID=UPI0015C66F3C|nr:hypothetical protein [Leptolyngbya ohadii]